MYIMFVVFISMWLNKIQEYKDEKWSQGVGLTQLNVLNLADI